MKRGKNPLPRNWADLLTVEDAQNILKHWQEQVEYYDGQLALAKLGAARHGRICRTRVALWLEVIERKQNGERCQDIIDAARQRGDEPLDLSEPDSTPVSPTKTGAKPKRKGALSVPHSGPSLFD